VKAGDACGRTEGGAGEQVVHGPAPGRLSGRGGKRTRFQYGMNKSWNGYVKKEVGKRVNTKPRAGQSWNPHYLKTGTLDKRPTS